MNGKASYKISTAFYTVFSLGFFWLFANAILNNRWYGIDQLKAIFSMILYAAVLLLFIKLTDRCEDFLKKYRCGVAASILLIVFGIQLAIDYWFRIDPVFDVEAIYKGAITWNRTGSLGNYMEYFCMFPNNLGGMFLLSGLFRLADFFHFVDYNTAACVLNSLLINSSFLLVFLTCDKLFGPARATAALLFSAGCLPILLYSPVFYTDTLTICLPILGYYFYICAKAAESPLKRSTLFVLMGIVFSVGMAIKMTVIIMLIAILIDAALTCRAKRYILPCASCIAIVLIACVGFRAIRADVLDREVYQEKNIPYSHWVMMGLNGIGCYNGDDYEYTKSFPDIPEKQAAVSKEIKARMQQYNPATFAAHLSNKTTYQFGSGLYGVDTMLDDNPQHINWFHKYIIHTSQANETCFQNFGSFLQGYHLLLLFLVACSGFAALRKRKSLNFRSIAPKIVLMGLILFLMAWESSSRYIINYLPVMTVCAFSGMDAWNKSASNASHVPARLGNHSPS